MRFLLDESADGRLGSYLRRLGHDVVAMARDRPASLDDWEVLDIAHREGRILIANDRDFGELVVAHGRPHAGVLLFRLDPQARLDAKIERLAYVLDRHADELDRFIVVTRTAVRVRP